MKTTRIKKLPSIQYWTQTNTNDHSLTVNLAMLLSGQQVISLNSAASAKPPFLLSTASDNLMLLLYEVISQDAVDGMFTVE